MNKMKLLFTLAVPVFLSQATQAQSSRLTAQAHWTHDGAEFKRTDSSFYNYLSSSRGGDLNNMLKFDDGTMYTFVLGDTQNNQTRWIQEFDGSNHLTSKVEQQWDLLLLTWANTMKYVYTYTASNMKATMITQHWDGTSAWITDSKNTYTYNAAGKLSQDDFALWDGVSAYVLNSQKLYYYDGSGHMVSETWQDIVGGSPVSTNRVNYTYTSTGKLHTTTNGTWNGVAWVDVDMYENTYDTSGRRISELHSINNGTVFVNDMMRLFSDFSGSNATTEINQTWDTAGTGSWNDKNKYSMTYNSSGQMTSKTGQSYDISIPGWVFAFGDTKANYYYGSYVSVKDINNAGGTAKMFPVPAENILNVEFNWNKAQASTVAITDMAGHVVMTINVAANQKSLAIPVADLATGIYMVNIVGAEGSIVKQIAVAH